MPALPSVAGLGLEPVDEVDDVVEAAASAGSDAASGDGDGQMGFAGAGRDSVTMPGVRRSRFGSTIRFILDAGRWCRSSSGGGSPARITWSWSARRHTRSGPDLDGGGVAGSATLTACPRLSVGRLIELRAQIDMLLASPTGHRPREEEGIMRPRYNQQQRLVRGGSTDDGDSSRARSASSSA